MSHRSPGPLDALNAGNCARDAGSLLGRAAIDPFRTFGCLFVARQQRAERTFAAFPCEHVTFGVT